MNDELYEKIIKFQQGNDYVFTEIYLCTYNLVYRCTFQMLKNENDTNDIVQIVYLKIYRKMNTLDDVTKFKSWLLSIVYNESKNFLKSQQRNCKYIDTSFDISDEADTLEICDNAPDSEEQCLINETNDILKGLIEMLPEEQSQVLMLYYFEEKDISEIAEILSLPTGTVKSRLNYARKKLKKSIESYESRNEVRLHSGVLGFINAQYMSSLRNIAMMFRTATTAAPIMLSAATLSVSVVSTPYFSNYEDKALVKITEPTEIVQYAEESSYEIAVSDIDTDSGYNIIVTAVTEPATEISGTATKNQLVKTTGTSAVSVSSAVSKTNKFTETPCNTTVKASVQETTFVTTVTTLEEKIDIAVEESTEKNDFEWNDKNIHTDMRHDNDIENWWHHTEKYENKYKDKFPEYYSKSDEEYPENDCEKYLDRKIENYDK